ncbi:PIG-L deacetylase family protein [Actinomycetospora sp. OC33-EN08]|uniref:PIG-L deacetylase family protein n=1 Tax=Actinomycetospora aurantiaca TaxID=3129233 RepID=A0ABU8MI55_9PSEU
METFPDDWSRALAVAAHPDDLEYGVSAAIAAWTSAGRTVTYLLVTRGEAGIATTPPAEAGPAREAEERASAAVVGVHDVRFLDHPDGTVVESVALRRDIARVIRDVRPDLVVTMNHHEQWDGGGWNSADHRAVGRAAIDAVSDAGTRWIFPDDGAAHQVRHLAVAASPAPTHEVDVTGFVETAVASLACHRRYLAALDDAPVEDQARAVVEQMVGGAGSPRVPFELLS